MTQVARALDLAIPDQFADRQAEALERKGAAVIESLRDLPDMPAAIVEKFEADIDFADALEEAYRSGHADLSVLEYSAEIRAKAVTEAGILAAELGAMALGGAGAAVKLTRALGRLDLGDIPGGAIAAMNRAREVAKNLAEDVRAFVKDKPGSFSFGRGERLNRKTVEDERAKRLDRDRIEASAKAEALQLDALEGGHVVSRHGPEVDPAMLRVRVTSGIAPDGKISPSRYSAQFNSYTDIMTTREAALKAIETEFGIDLSQPWKEGMDRDYVLNVPHHRRIDDGFAGGQEVKVSDPRRPGKSMKVYANPEPVHDISATRTRIRWDPPRDMWKVTQQYPLAKGWDQATKSYPEGLNTP